MIKFSNWYNVVSKPSHFEDVDPVSMTMPDMSLSLKSLVERYTRGQEVPIFPPVYLGEDEVVPIERMDEIERKEYARSLAKEVRETKSRIGSRVSDFEAAKAEAAKAKAEAVSSESGLET